MFKDRQFTFAVIIALALVFTAGASAQSKLLKSIAEKPAPPAKPSPTPQPQVDSTPLQQITRGKRNERPFAANGDRAQTKPASGTETNIPVYSYEFTHPYFLVRKVVIEHDENGRGTISFMKDGYKELVTDPLTVSPAALGRLRAAFAALNFLNSNEDYQYQKDFSHLGKMKITVRKEGRERTSEFNWTDNRDAKAVTEEYRKLGNQYIWMFDINLARENQPLQSPALLDELDSLVRRKEVSDPTQLLPFLKKLSDDERIPLIARNHASKIIAAIEKQAAKESKQA